MIKREFCDDVILELAIMFNMSYDEALARAKIYAALQASRGNPE